MYANRVLILQKEAVELVKKLHIVALFSTEFTAKNFSPSSF